MVKAKGTRKNSPLALLQENCRKFLHNCDKCERQAQWTTVDHIIPVSFLQAVGLKEQSWEDGANLQKLCKSCQNLKANRFDFNNPKTLPLFRKYLAMLEKQYQLTT